MLKSKNLSALLSQSLTTLPEEPPLSSEYLETSLGDTTGRNEPIEQRENDMGKKARNGMTQEDAADLEGCCF